MLALIGDGQTFARVLLGLPFGADFGANALEQRVALVRRKRRVAALEQQCRKALLTAQDRAPGRLHRVGQKDRLNRQLTQQLQDLLEAQAGALELRERVLHAPGLRPLGILLQVLAAPADAMHFLGDVRQLKPGGERAYQLARQARRAPAHAYCERIGRACDPFAPADCREPVLLDELK